MRKIIFFNYNLKIDQKTKFKFFFSKSSPSYWITTSNNYPNL